MTSKQLPDVVADDYRPIKRHRPAEEYDDNHSNHHAYRPPPVSGSSGLQFEAESNADLAAKKARKRPLSCGECRRYDICDRVFPCQSCCKRGCAEICPDGALTGGKGSRFILANTEQLHEKIKSMSERIRQLEDALQSVYARVAPDEHPLLRQELLLIKKTAELFGLEQQFTPSTTRNDFRREESSRVHNSSSSREGTEDRSLMPPKSSVGRSTEDDVDDITRLSRSFPSPWSMSVELNPGMRQRIRDMLPPRAEAQYLCEQARHNAFWQYNPDASETFLPNLIHSVYTSPLNALLPHRLGLFLMILAIGSRLDSKRCVSETASEKYHHLARVALCEVPVMDDTSFDAVNALFFMEWYLLMFCDEKKSVEYAWGIMGLMTKLAHTVDRDGVRSKVIPEELDKRRALFWDLMSMDTRLALMLRRPPSLSLKHVDAKQPGYNYGAASSSDARCRSALYHEWHHSFHMQCMVPVVEIVASPQAPNYSEVLGLDSQIRDFDVPSLLQITNDAPPHPLPMQRAMTACTREIALLQLHRNYYIHALTSMEEFTVKNKYAPSVLAVYTSACNLIWTVYTLYRLQPELASRYTIFWNNCFSAALALCAFVQKAPSSPLTPLAFEELDNVLRLFGNAREHCASAAKLFPIFETIVARCRQIFIRYKVNGTTNGKDETEELCKLVKRTGLLSSQVQSSLNADMTPGLDPFEHAHPTLHRCLEQARMNSSSTCDEKFLARIHALASADASQTAAEKCFAASFGTEVHESCWMSWF
ncbi:hypothetical protein C8Q75DRAFT_728229 [Abortiporus biennis]|nr:hypothetical protein C8Q75DRAFT_728229 [Abortiporus biennis]